MAHVSAHADRSRQPADRRAHFRQPVRSLAYVELGEGNGGIVLNVSETGIAVQAVMSLLSDDLPCLRVQLAHSKKIIEAKGSITWTDALRKTAGVEFVDLSQEARSLLREWVALEAPSQEFVEETTAPMEKGELAVPAQRLSEPPEALPEPSRLNAAATLRQPSQELANASLPQHVMSGGLPAFNASSVATAVVVPVAPTGPEATPAVHSVRQIPAENAAAASAATTSMPKAAESPRSDLKPRASASLPADQFEFKPIRTITHTGVPVFSPAARRFKLPVLVAIFVLLSVAAGWLAGHGVVDGAFQRATHHRSASKVAESSEALPPTSPTVSNIEVVDLNHERWLVPMQGPLVPSRTLSPRLAGSHWARLQQTEPSSDNALSEPVQGDAGDEDKPSPPVLAPAPGGVESELPARAGAHARPPILPPAGGAADPQAAALQSGELIHRVEPVYPSGALAQRIEGTVTLYAVIDASGKVRSVESLNGPALLIPAAIAAVRQWRYSPSLLHGQAVQTERQIRIVFRLSEPPR